MEKLASWIVTKCNEVAGSELVPCIKQSVYAMLVTVSGVEFFGANWMTNGSVTVCPRVEQNCPSGQGYHLCSEVCNQEFHAEVAAIDACINAGYNPAGATVYVVGHTYCCDNCIAAMVDNGVARAFVIDSRRAYDFTSS